MNAIDDLTVKEAKELMSLFNNKSHENDGLQTMLNQYVIVRTYSAGVWFGKLTDKSGNEVILKEARRMWSWKAQQSISLSACARYGIDRDNSKIVEPVDEVWLQAIEIIHCTEYAINSIRGAKYVEAK